MLCTVYFAAFIALILSAHGCKFNSKKEILRNRREVFNSDDGRYALHQKRFSKAIPNIDKSESHRRKMIESIRSSFNPKHKLWEEENWDRMFPVIKGREYVFSNDPGRKDLYLYNEFFNPSEFGHLYCNYFNPWFDENFDTDAHSREKRSLNVYDGIDADMQFTSDDIDEYINLKTHKVYKRKPNNLNEAFERVENDLAELMKMRSNQSIFESSQSKLRIEPKNGDIELDGNMPTDVEHLDRHISEEVIRVYVPKKRNKQIKTKRMAYKLIQPQKHCYHRQSRKAGNYSFDSNDFNSELEQEKFFSDLVENLKPAESFQNATG